MKKFLAIIILSLSLITPSKSDDIRDFQIEGMSIRDSLLDYVTKEEINNLAYRWYPKKKYKVLYNFNLKLKTFEVLEIVVKSGDQNYTIQQIVGGFFYRENFSNCYKKQNEIALDIQDLFDKDVKKKSYEKDHSADKTGESKNNTIQFTFKTKDVIRVSCYDWSEKITKEKNWVDSLRVSILGANFRNWINNKAYK